MFHISLRPAILVSKPPLACFWCLYSSSQTAENTAARGRTERDTAPRRPPRPSERQRGNKNVNTRSLNAIPVVVTQGRQSTKTQSCRFSSSSSCCDCGAAQETPRRSAATYSPGAGTAPRSSMCETTAHSGEIQIQFYLRVRLCYNSTCSRAEIEKTENIY